MQRWVIGWLIRMLCSTGVADQLQTNFASDLRVILKTVFEAVSSRQQQETESKLL